jgi:hypothetical protein
MSHPTSIKRLCLASLSCLAMLAGCSSIPDDEYRAITQAERLLNEWGTASASTPILHHSDENYAFKVNKTPDDFFKSAKEESNAGIARHTQVVTSILLSGTAQFDPLNEELVNSQLQKFRSANLPQEAVTLTEEQKAAVIQTNNFIKEQAKANFQSCITAADTETSTAATLTDQEQILALNSSAINRRKECLADYQASITPMKNQPEFPNLPANNVPAINRLQQTPFSGKSALNTPWSDAEKSPLSEAALPDHQALAQAATNNFLNGMFTTLSENKDASFFGVTMVAVNPGWRTRNNHKAIVNMMPRLVYAPATKAGVKQYLNDSSIDKELRAEIALNYSIPCSDMEFEAICKNKNEQSSNVSNDWLFDNFEEAKDKDGLKLNVTALSPISYAQNLDLQNRKISQFNLSLMLAASLREAGAEQAAEIFTDFSRKQQKDFISKNALNSVNVFSYSANMFGVEVGPEFVAATLLDNDPELRMQRQSFPILLKFQVESEQALNRFLFVKDCPHEVSYCLMEARLTIDTTHRWQPLERRFTDFLSPSNKYGLSTAQLMRVKSGLKDSETLIQDAFYSNKLEELRNKLFGTVVSITLPQKESKTKKSPSIEFLHPQNVSLKLAKDGKSVEPKDVKFVVSGKHFSELTSAANKTDVKANLSPIYSGQTIEKAEIVGDSIILDMKITENKGPVAFIMTHKGKKISGATNANSMAQLTVQNSKPPAKTSTSYQIQATNNGQTSVILPPGSADLPTNVTKVVEGLVATSKTKDLLPLTGTCAYLITQKPNTVVEMGDCPESKSDP